MNDGLTLLPLDVSLSLTRKVPLLFSKCSSILSESRRVILPKYHLVKSKEKGQKDTKAQICDEEKLARVQRSNNGPKAWPQVLKVVNNGLPFRSSMGADT